MGLQKEEREPEGQEQTEPRAEVPKLEGECLRAFVPSSEHCPSLPTAPEHPASEATQEGVGVSGLAHGLSTAHSAGEERARMWLPLALGLTVQALDGYETITPFLSLSCQHSPPEPPGPGSLSPLKVFHILPPAHTWKTNSQD